MTKFRKKPVVIDAVQYKEYGKLVKGMCNSRSCYTSGNTHLVDIILMIIKFSKLFIFHIV